MSEHDDPPDDCMNCGMCDWCIDRSIDYAEEHETCDYCGGTGIDEDAADDGTEDYDTCPICGGFDPTRSG